MIKHLQSCHITIPTAVIIAIIIPSKKTTYDFIGFWLPIFLNQLFSIFALFLGYNLLNSKLWSPYSRVSAAMWTHAGGTGGSVGRPSLSYIQYVCLPFLLPDWLRGFTSRELWNARGSIKMSGLYQVRWEEWLCGPRGQVNNSEDDCLPLLVRHSQTHATLYLCIINPSHFSLIGAF